jgi:predicted MarR family transcription regulator
VAGRNERDDPERALADALARARRHANNAVAELLEAFRAVVDAASLAVSGAPAASNPLFEPVDRWIARASRGWAADGGLSSGIAAEVAAALDVEIARWEERAKSDADARQVLRAFLGLREVLWELGVRAPRDAAEASERESAPPARAPQLRRVQRVAVQG